MIFSGEQKGIIYVLASGLCYGLIGYFGISIMQENLSAYNMLFWRFLVSTLVMFGFSFLQMREKYFLQKNFSQLTKIFFYSALFHGTSSAFYFMSSARIGSGLAMILFFIYPLIVVILNRIFFQTKISKYYFFSISAIFIGIILLADLQHFSMDLFGIFLGILAAIFFGLYVFAVQKSSIPPITLAFTVSLGCCFASGIFALIDGSFLVPQNIKPVFNIIAMGVISTALPILFFLRGLNYINSTKASLLGVCEPLAVLFFGWLLLAEEINNMQLIGSAIILLGGAIALIEKNQKGSSTTNEAA
jgi:drug/metabolite transporter (DMT)-like permease